MRFLVHSDINASTIQQNLGLPEYSYYFVLKSYLSVLSELGQVIMLDDPSMQADSMYEEARCSGEDCVFICFAPPHRAPVGLRCPTVCIFAWEFSNLPDRAWDNEPRNDWRYVLRQHGRALTLSSHTAGVVRQTLGKDFPVCAIPTPVYSLMNGTGQDDQDVAFRLPPSGSRSLTTSCSLIDTQQADTSRLDYLGDTSSRFLHLPPFPAEEQVLSLRFDQFSMDAGLLGGCYEPESWGIWSRTSSPWMLLPVRPIPGRYRLSLEAGGYGPNAGRIISVELGSQVQSMTLSAALRWHELDFTLTSEDVLLRFHGLDNRGVPGAPDLRGMGIGLRALQLARISDVEEASRQDGTSCSPAPESEPGSRTVLLDGVVYTSIFNPADGRKNWGDMLTAFCHAFRDEARATLLLKMTHRHPGAFMGRFHYLMQTIGPVRCRIILLHGFLDDVAFRQLAEVTTYALNTSHGEGLCLPLMEYMSLGIPAVSPCHTAMLDYVNAENSFILSSSPEPHIWPHDPSERLSTLRQRIDRAALVQAYRDSFDLAIHHPQRYQQMSQAARISLRAFCEKSVVRDALADFFKIKKRENITP